MQGGSIYPKPGGSITRNRAANRLIRLAAFQNPEFYKAQAMRLSVWDKPRVIGCAENYPHHIALPLGCFDAALSLLRDNGIASEVQDERFGGQLLDVKFIGNLRMDQEVAISAMLHHDHGVLCAPTAFGKTVVGAAIIARRRVNTLVVIHRTELSKQWQELCALPQQECYWIRWLPHLKCYR